MARRRRRPLTACPPTRRRVPPPGNPGASAGRRGPPRRAPGGPGRAQLVAVGAGACDRRCSAIRLRSHCGQASESSGSSSAAPSSRRSCAGHDPTRGRPGRTRTSTAGVPPASRPARRGCPGASAGRRCAHAGTGGRWPRRRPPRRRRAPRAARARSSAGRGAMPRKPWRRPTRLTRDGAARGQPGDHAGATPSAAGDLCLPCGRRAARRSSGRHPGARLAAWPGVSPRRRPRPGRPTSAMIRPSRSVAVAAQRTRRPSG